MRRRGRDRYRPAQARSLSARGPFHGINAAPARSRRRGRDACSPATARLRIARRQLRPRTFEPSSVVVKFDGVEVQCSPRDFKFTPTNVEDRPGFAALLATSDSGGLWTQGGGEICLTHEGPGLRARAQ